MSDDNVLSEEETETNDDNEMQLSIDNDSYYKRNQVGFWLLGLFNNFAYVVMLSAAHDLLNPTIIGQDEKFNIVQDNTSYLINNNSGRDCNALSTGSILLADVLPAIFIKLIAPFINVSTRIKVLTASLLSLSSFIIVACSSIDTQTFVGVSLAALASGLGEVTFLSYTHKFNPMVLSAWSSGTGGSGILGSGLYTLLTHAGVSPKTTLLVMLFIPVGMFLTFTVVLKVPTHRTVNQDSDRISLLSNLPDDQVLILSSQPQPITISEKLSLIPGLLKYMVPLGLVYFFEYVINQGLFELMYFENSVLEHSQQYRWYQFDYSIGVIISRSSLSLLKIQNIKLLAILQFINLILALFQSIYWTVSSIWIILVFILWEGLLGGAAYVNTFYRISTETEPRHKEFSLGISSLADSSCIGLAGVLSIYLHSWICSMPSPA